MNDFHTALMINLDAAAALGVTQGQLRHAAETYGGVSAAKNYVKRGRVSDGFDALARAGHLELSMEALIVSSAWHSLFTDEEVNACFDLLCGADYFRNRK